MINPDMPQNGFLFGDSNGPWKTDRMTDVLTRETQKHLNVRITNRDFRQIAVAIDRRHVRPGEVHDDEDDEDDEEINDHPHDSMACHNSTTAGNWYGILKDSTREITPETLDLFRRISDRWHRWLGLLSRLPRPKDPDSIDLEPSIPISIEEKLEQTILRVFGPSFEWRSDEQKEATLKMAKGVSSLFVVLPTGGGKTMASLIPAMFEDAKTTVFVTPLKELANDVLNTCLDLNIDAIMFGKHPLRYAKIVIVVTESILNQQLMGFLRDLYLAKHLDRIVVDE